MQGKRRANQLLKEVISDWNWRGTYSIGLLAVFQSRFCCLSNGQKADYSPGTSELFRHITAIRHLAESNRNI